jgi:hypothetical protein
MVSVAGDGVSADVPTTEEAGGAPDSTGRVALDAAVVDWTVATTAESVD